MQPYTVTVTVEAKDAADAHNYVLTAMNRIANNPPTRMVVVSGPER